jgi:hypothetical protein
MYFEVEGLDNITELLYFKDRKIFVDSVLTSGSKFVLTANGIYDVEKDNLRPYIKGEQFVYLRGGRMF